MGQRRALLSVAAGFGLAQEGSPLSTRCTTPGEPRCGTESDGGINTKVSVTDYVAFFLPVSPPHTFSC